MRDGAAETEMRSMVAALKISFASGLQEDAIILRAVSGTTDHADAATKPRASEIENALGTIALDPSKDERPEICFAN